MTEQDEDGRGNQTLPRVPVKVFSTRAPLAWITPKLIPLAEAELVKLGFERESYGDGSTNFIKGEIYQTYVLRETFSDWKNRLLESIDVIAYELGITPIEWIIANK